MNNATRRHIFKFIAYEYKSDGLELDAVDWSHPLTCQFQHQLWSKTICRTYLKHTSELLAQLKLNS